MSCPTTSGTSKPERLISFTSQFSLNGEYSSSLVFADPFRQDTDSCGELCDPVEVKMFSTNEFSTCMQDVQDDPEMVVDLENLGMAMVGESKNWVSGLIRGFGRSLSSGNSSYDVRSYYEYLTSKPISTQNFYQVSLSQILDTIFRYYSGTPSDLISLSGISNTLIKGPVQGNDTMAELKLLAQAGLSNLFVQVGGKLTIEGWKDQHSVIDLKIPAQAIISAEPSQLSRSNTTFIRSRGGSVSKLEAGERVLSQKEDVPSSGSKTVLSGIKTDRIEIKHNNLTGTKKDIQNATELTAGAEVAGKKKNVSDGNFTRTYKPTSGKSFGPEPTKISSLVVGTTQSKDSEAVFSKNKKVLNKGFSKAPNINNIKANVMRRSFPVAYSSFGKGAFGSDNFNNNFDEDGDANSDKSIFEEAEVICIHPNVGECGIKNETISNKYVVSKDVLFDLALRRYQEMELAANTWNVETVFIPTIKLNQVVEFEIPNIYTNTDPQSRDAVKKIKGIVGAISVDHSTSSEGESTKMRLSISDVACLGKNLFESSNLIDSKFAGQSSGELNGWLTSAHAIDATASVENGTITLFAAAPEKNAIGLADRQGAKASFTQNQLRANSDYIWMVEYQTLDGNQPVELRFPGHPSGTELTTLNGNGVFEGYFNTGEHRTSATWDFSMAPPSVSTYFRVVNFTLKRRTYA